MSCIDNSVQFYEKKMKSFLAIFICLITAFSGYPQHSIILKSGEKIEGIVMSLNDDILDVAVNRELQKIHLKQISSIFFNEYIPYDGSFDPSDKVKLIKSGNYTIKYIMKDREMIVPPKISIATEDRGIVAVDVVINRRGIVTSAKPGGVGSTTSSEYLYTKAKFAAQGARFDEAPKGPIETKGQIIITY